MKKYLVIIISILVAVNSCNRFEKSKVDFYKEFYSVLNDIIRFRLNNAKSIKIETLPVYRTGWGSMIPPSDTIFPQPPPPPGYISYSKLMFDRQLRLKNLDSLDAAFMYNSIDSTKVIILDSTKLIIPVISRLEFNTIFNDSDLDVGYDKLFEKYGSSCFIQVSTPIFNSDCTKMIISISYMCGPLWGYGSLLVLEKKHGNWRIIDDYETWVS